MGRFKEQFSGTRQLDGLTSAAAGLPVPVFYAVSAAAAAGAALGGYAVATKAPLEGMGFLAAYLTLYHFPRDCKLFCSLRSLSEVKMVHTHCFICNYGRLVTLARRNTVESIAPPMLHTMKLSRTLYLRVRMKAVRKHLLGTMRHLIHVF